MSVNYGSKRVVVGAHYGLRDWLSQRVTALLMALYTLVLLVQRSLHPQALWKKQTCVGDLARLM